MQSIKKGRGEVHISKKGSHSILSHFSDVQFSFSNGGGGGGEINKPGAC